MESMTDQDFSELWTNLVERDSGRRLPTLSREERMFFAVNLLRGSVPRSGLIGYFENVTGRDIFDAHQGLTELKLFSVLSLLQQAQAIILGDRPLPPDELPVQVLSDSLTDTEYEAAINRLDAAVHPIQERLLESDDDIWNALCQFASGQGLKPKA